MVPLNLKESIRLRFWPVMVTLLPGLPLAGVKLVIAGNDWATLNGVALKTVLPPTVTEIKPVVAPEGTWVSMVVLSCTNRAPVIPLKATVLAPVNPVPVMVTVVPVVPEVGVKLVILWACTRLLVQKSTSDKTIIPMCPKKAENGR